MRSLILLILGIIGLALASFSAFGWFSLDLNVFGFGFGGLALFAASFLPGVWPNRATL